MKSVAMAMLLFLPAFPLGIPFLGDIQGASTIGLVGTVSGPTVLRPTVWATGARSPARGIHSDHFHSIEGIPHAHANGDLYTVEQTG